MSDRDSTPQGHAGRARRTIATCCLLASLGTGLATGQARDEPRLRLEEMAASQDRFQRLEAGLGEWGFTLDFETGDLRGWEATGAAFRCQPTLGDNPRVRARESSNHRGSYWVGTYECYQGGRRSPGEVQGDGPQGTLTSRSFIAEAGTLSFLVGGGAAYETRVELLRLDPIEGAFRVLYASGSNSESMRRVEWDLTPWAGSPTQLRVVDASSGGWGHVNVDDFRFTPARAPGPPREDLVPVPELRGNDLPGTRELLGSRRLELGRVEFVPAAAELGSVVAQDPEPGREVPFGSSVAVVVARGVEVPRLIERDWREARLQLEERGLAPGRVRETPSFEPVGTVLAQEPPPGREVPLETRVDVEVAVQIETREPVSPDPPSPDPQRPDPQRPDPQRPDPQSPDPGTPATRRPEPVRLDPMLLLAGLVALAVVVGLWRVLRSPADEAPEGEPEPLPRIVAHRDLGRQGLELDGNELTAPEIRLRGRRGTFESTLEVDGPLV